MYNSFRITPYIIYIIIKKWINLYFILTLNDLIRGEKQRVWPPVARRVNSRSRCETSRVWFPLQDKYFFRGLGVMVLVVFDYNDIKYLIPRYFYFLIQYNVCVPSAPAGFDSYIVWIYTTEFEPTTIGLEVEVLDSNNEILEIQRTH